LAAGHKSPTALIARTTDHLPLFTVLPTTANGPPNNPKEASLQYSFNGTYTISTAGQARGSGAVQIAQLN
jgi:hypothetical protein